MSAKVLTRVLILPLVALACAVFAADKAPPAGLKDKLGKLFPEIKISDIKPTPVDGVYEITAGGEYAYVTGDGKYMIHGDMIELATQKNLTEARRAVYRTQVLKDIGEQNMIVFAPKSPKYTITVFTDVDCGYCRLLHSQIDKYNGEGIAVRYAFFPRAGIDSESARKAESVWCSKDRRDALTRAKKGENISAPQCPNPVAREYRAGLDIGVHGTPAIVTADGRMIGGYMPPDKLVQELAHPSSN